MLTYGVPLVARGAGGGGGAVDGQVAVRALGGGAAAARSIFDGAGRGPAGRREGAPGCASSGVPLGFRRSDLVARRAEGSGDALGACLLVCLFG